MFMFVLEVYTSSVRFGTDGEGGEPNCCSFNLCIIQRCSLVVSSSSYKYIVAHRLSVAILLLSFFVLFCLLVLCACI